MSQSTRSRRARVLRIAAASVAIASGSVFACSETLPPDLGGTFFGPVTLIGGGSGRAYITLDRAGIPTELGLALTEGMLTNLPAAFAEYVFAFPEQASATPFKHAVINWEPNGHPPAGVYTVPHFDFHFYMISNATRAGVVFGDPQLDAKMVRRPTAEFIPAGYAAGMAMANMGLHWLDPQAPERQGQPFTKTFVYGSYDGVFTFGEPMIAKSYLETKPATVVTPVKLPAQYAVRGYHPTSYTVAYDAGTKEYRVALTGLVSR
jgi:hypothetical protein